MSEAATGQVSRTAADVYDEFFVPALFGQWAPKLAEAARLSPGDEVLDVACGTGVFARAAAEHIKPGGSVVGLDRNEGMLSVARRKEPTIEWRLGLAESLPFEDRSFDAVVSQFGLMFFEDRIAALREMWRVLRPGGRLAVAVWDDVESSPGYAEMVALLERLFGAQTASALRAPFVLGDRQALSACVDQAGIAPAEIRTLDGTARFPSLEGWVHTDVKGWTLADLIDDSQYETLVRESHSALSRFVGGDGTVAFAAPAHIVTALRN